MNIERMRPSVEAVLEEIREVRHELAAIPLGCEAASDRAFLRECWKREGSCRRKRALESQRS
jgi:hypothetical protein